MSAEPSRGSRVSRSRLSVADVVLGSYARESASEKLVSRVSASLLGVHLEETGDHPTQLEETSQKPQLGVGILVPLVLIYLYFEGANPLWQQLYKNRQVALCPPDCLKLYSKLVAANTNEQFKVGCASFADRRQHPSDEAVVADDENVNGYEKLEERGCPWYISKPDGRQATWKVSPQTFTKGTVLAVTGMVGAIGSYIFNFAVGGWERLSLCFDLRRTLRFAVVGLMFGLAQVCAFLAQDALSPGSYALYSQLGIIVVPILWVLVFRKLIPLLSWTHLVLVTLGIMMYTLSQMGGSQATFDAVGLIWVLLKVGISGCAAIWSEMFLKKDPDLPFSVQISFILPWKALACLMTIWLLPPFGLPDRPLLFFHDWKWTTWVIVVTTLGDTVISAVIAKTFDSVVKSVLGVFGIVFPTFTVSLIVGYETLDASTTEGKMKAWWAFGHHRFFRVCARSQAGAKHGEAGEASG